MLRQIEDQVLQCLSLQFVICEGKAERDHVSPHRYGFRNVIDQRMQGSRVTTVLLASRVMGTTTAPDVRLSIPSP